MPIDDFFHARLGQMMELHHPLVVLANRLPWPQIEAALAPAFERKNRQGEVVEINDLFDTTLVIAGGGVSAAAGRAAFADSVDGFLAVSEACIQPMPRKARNYAAKPVVMPMPSNFCACAKPLNANARSLVSCCERSRENWRRQSWCVPHRYNL